ncbi:MAG: serine/threonine protein kinase [Myxococcota bacterium]|nr:serine/threonine protein kinase [Myxococcota bacterium]
MAATDGHGPGADLIGRSLSGYMVASRLGSGATGVVFRATHPDQDRPVALKVLHDNLGSISSLKRRFEREARVLAKLDHPNVVYITDFGVVEGHTYIAMELLEGQTLEQLLEEAPIAPERALSITKQILAGLAFAHGRQVVHRDLKPANVFLCKTEDGADRVKLLDFGLAKMLSVDDLSQDGTLTRKGRIVGTPAYMAPEQITGVSLDVRADVYALGILLYELLADRRPFLSERRSELLRAHLLEPVPPLSEARKSLVVHPDLERMVQKALAKDPAHRYADASEMALALEALPPGAARVEKAQHAPVGRTRTGATSELISAHERRAASEAAGLPLEDPSIHAKTQTASAPSGMIAAPALASPPRRSPGAEPEYETTHQTAAEIRRELSSRPPSLAAPRPRSASGPSTAMLYATALALFALAAVLWLALGRA